MNFKHMIIVVALMGLIASCKKDKNPEKSHRSHKKRHYLSFKGHSNQ
jgi:hypothetical protein